MIDPLSHVALFVLAALAIVFAGATFSESEDAPLLRALPKKVGWFCLWCAVLALAILLLEHTLASTT
jgi:VIT1/CCC1 family predicted Fe2+/Mn2+ transporter